MKTKNKALLVGMMLVMVFAGFSATPMEAYATKDLPGDFVIKRP